MTLQEKIQKKAEGFGKLAPVFLEGAEFALNNQWISVNDDLPCNHEEFIVVNDGDIITKSVYTFSDFFGFTTNYMEKRGSEWCWFLSFKGSITHWFPIPELPKEKE